MQIATGLALLAAGSRLGRRAFFLAAVPPAVTFAWLLTQADGILDGVPVEQSFTWVEQLGLTLSVRVDGFSLLMGLLVSGIGTLIPLYATGYFGSSTAGLHKLAGLLAVFTAAMLGVVTASTLLVLYVAWELTSVSSYLLVGWKDTDPKARASALQALLITGTGGIAMLGGFVLIGTSAGTYDIAELVASPPTGTMVDVGLVLVLLGAFTKSAQWPFSSWLPGAMVAPTPVSAFLHSATMVKAGVYLIARLAPAFALAPTWRPLVLTVGLITMIVGGWRALRQYDLKRILAFGTVSQLGFMVVLFGAGLEEATLAGVAVLFAHALFKAAIFLIVGVIDHQAHTRDIRALGSYAPGWIGPKAVAVIAGASMAGIPLMFGFIAKEAAYEAWVHSHQAYGPFVLAGLVTGSVLTFAYTARLLLGSFRPGFLFEGLGATEPRVPGDVPTVEQAPAPKLRFWGWSIPLALLTVLFGVLPDLASRLVYGAAGSLDERIEPYSLKLWHGFNTALALSALTITVGVLFVVFGRVVGKVQARLQSPFDGNELYRICLEGLPRTAKALTAVVQNGSLPVYIGVILLTVVLLPVSSLLTVPWPDGLTLATGPGDWVVAALIIVSGTAAAVLRNRMAAVLCLGAVGYAMALIFVLQGAPDLALTQFSIETLGAILFVLVLRKLPRRFEERPTQLGLALRIGVSVAVGVAVFFFALMAAGVRTAPSLAPEFIDRSVPEGGGNNVVNVILVDFRGFDTMGEVTVILVAALGVISLTRLSGRGRRGDDALPDGPPERGPDAPAEADALADAPAKAQPVAAEATP